jgi:hypothetical protein
MSINDLPAIMGTVLIVAGLVLIGVSTWSRAEGSEKTTRLGHSSLWSAHSSWGCRYSWRMENRTQVRAPFKLGHYPGR